RSNPDARAGRAQRKGKTLQSRGSAGLQGSEAAQDRASSATPPQSHAMGTIQKAPRRASRRVGTTLPLRTLASNRVVEKKGIEGLDHLLYRGDAGDLTAAQQEQLKAQAATGRFK